jgi:hypothetical protein
MNDRSFFINYGYGAYARQEEFAGCGKYGRFLTSDRQLAEWLKQFRNGES